MPTTRASSPFTYRRRAAINHTDFGPDERQLNRIGIAPDVAVAPTPDDEAAGRDPQLQAALDVLDH
jgi:C-terminal processing protease CtpA/Prc